MNTRIIRLLPLAIVTLVISSCISQRKLEYLQDPVETQKRYALQQSKENIIKPNDELYINVTSIDDPVFNFLGGETDNMRTGFGNDLAISLISFTVAKDGTIQFPILGKVHVESLTLDAARQKLEEQLQGYLNQPSVTIKFGYKKITVLGEVRQPGNHTYAKDQLNIFEAISLSGDMTVHGNRKEVNLLRKVDDKMVKYNIDMTKDNIVFAEYYYVQPDDIIYVKPRKSLKWNVVSVPISLILTTITTSILIINYFETNK